jgi:hypothetical protein
MLNDKDVQKKPEQRAGEAERKERNLIRKKAIGNYCRNGSEASAVVSTRPGLSRGNAVPVKTIAETMYVPESDHMKRRIRSGRPLNAHSMAEGRAVMKSIVNRWGE